MNSSKLPSGSRVYTLDAAFLRPPWRATGPSIRLYPYLIADRIGPRMNPEASQSVLECDCTKFYRTSMKPAGHKNSYGFELRLQRPG